MLNYGVPGSILYSPRVCIWAEAIWVPQKMSLLFQQVYFENPKCSDFTLGWQQDTILLGTVMLGVWETEYIARHIVKLCLGCTLLFWESDSLWKQSCLHPSLWRPQHWGQTDAAYLTCQPLVPSREWRVRASQSNFITTYMFPQGQITWMSLWESGRREKAQMAVKWAKTRLAIRSFAFVLYWHAWCRLERSG